MLLSVSWFIRLTMITFFRNQCRECCLQEGRNESSTLYPQAILEVCGWKLGSYPQVQG
jgi:hypothetical protein